MRWYILREKKTAHNAHRLNNNKNFTEEEKNSLKPITNMFMYKVNALLDPERVTKTLAGVLCIYMAVAAEEEREQKEKETRAARADEAREGMKSLTIWLTRIQIFDFIDGRIELFKML